MGKLRNRRRKNSLLINNEFDINLAAEILKQVVEKFKKENLFKPEPYRFFIKPDFDTASWSYRPPHYIILGDNIFESYTGDEKDKANFFILFILHEISHSLYTDYRIFKIIKFLEERDIPFNLFNLFEDARIEHLMVQKTNIISEFDWYKYIDLQKPYDTLDLFYWIVQKGGNKKSFDIIRKNLNSDLDVNADKVWQYYERTIDAKDTYEVIDIVEEWLKDFQDETLSIGINLFKGEIDILEAPDTIITQIKGAHEIITVTINDLKGKQEAKAASFSLQNVYAIKSLSNEKLLSKEKVRDGFDKKLIRQITKEIEHIFLDTARVIKTSTPSKRLNIRNLLLKKPNIYKKKKSLTPKKKKIIVILDISGSMTKVMDEMLPLLEVFNILAKKGYVEGHLVLSVSFYTTEAAYETFKFPLKDDVINKIVTYNTTEGLAEVMKHLTPLLKNNDYIFVFTDGLLADDPLNKKYFNKQKIEFYGVYLTGVSSFGYDLDKYFKNNIVENDLLLIAKKMVEILRVN